MASASSAKRSRPADDGKQEEEDGHKHPRRGTDCHDQDHDTKIDRELVRSMFIGDTIEEIQASAKQLEAKGTRITRINFTEESLWDLITTMGHLKAILRCFPGVKDLTFCIGLFSDIVECTLEFADLLAELVHLERLTIHTPFLSDPVLERLCTCKTLQDLDVSCYPTCRGNSKVTTAGLAAVAAHGNLKEFAMCNWSDSLLEDDSFVVLTHSTTLQRLWINNLHTERPLTDRAVCALAGIPTLHTLRISGWANCKITDKSLQAIGRSSIHDLNIAGNTSSGCSDAGLHALVGAHLQTFDMQYCFTDTMTGAGIAHLCANSPLQTLNLNACAPRILHEQALAGIAACSTLRRVHLRYVRVAAPTLALLGTLPNLESLDLAVGHTLSDQLFVNLAEHPTLQEADFRQCYGSGCTVKGFRALGSIPTLNTLRLGQCKFQAMPTGAIEAIAAHTNAAVLDLDGYAGQLTVPVLTHLARNPALTEVIINKHPTERSEYIKRFFTEARPSVTITVNGSFDVESLRP